MSGRGAFSCCICGKDSGTNWIEGKRYCNDCRPRAKTIPRDVGKQSSTTLKASVDTNLMDPRKRTTLDLEHSLRRVVVNDNNSSCCGLARVALNFLNDPWNHSGLSKDDLEIGRLVVLWAVARAFQTRMPSEFVFRELPSSSQLEAQDLYYGLETNFLCLPPEGQLFTERAKRVVDDIRTSVSHQLKRLGFGKEQWVDWLSVALPMPHDTDGLTVELFGRTSSGKTTVVRRLVEHLCPEWNLLVAKLAESPSAHTTRIPVILDLGPTAEHGWWFGSGSDRNVGGYIRPAPLQISHRDDFEAALAKGHEKTFRWVRFILPSKLAKKPIRVVDLPGTHGFDSGAWARKSLSWLFGADAIVLPVDRRYFRCEERTDLWHAMRWIPVHNIAFAVRWVSPEASRMTCSEFVDSRVLQAMEPNFPEVTKGKNGTGALLRLLRQIKTFEVSRRTDSNRDEIPQLAEWILSQTNSPSKKPTHSMLSALASGGAAHMKEKYHGSAGILEAARIARIALHRIGLLRAWTNYLSEVTADDQ